MPEIEAIIEAARDQKHQERKFMASLQGVDLEDEKDSSFDDVVARAKAKAMGKTQDQMEFEEIGFAFDEEE